MDLLHTEIQTEFRDLVTVPNLYMVTQPLLVVHDLEGGRALRRRAR